MASPPVAVVCVGMAGNNAPSKNGNSVTFLKSDTNHNEML
jgi:hypothetical protein